MNKLARLGSAVVALASVVVVGGCTNSNPVNSGNVQIPIQATTVGGDGSYECVLIGFARISLRPLNPDVQSVLTSEGEFDVLVEQLLQFNLTDQPCSLGFTGSLPPVTLPPGQYQLSRLQLRNPQLFDEDGGSFFNCMGSGSLAAIYDQVLTIEEGVALRFVIDVDAMLAQLMASNNCNVFFSPSNITNILTVEVN